MKEIATIPPLPKREDELVLSATTGQPRRHPLVVAIALLGYGALALIAVGYGVFWWLAAHPSSFAHSANLIVWFKPEPGKWLSLTLVSALTLLAAAGGAAPAVVGFSAWNGHKWTRVAMFFSLLLLTGAAVCLSWWMLAAIPLAVAQVVLVWLPPAGRYFARWEAFRGRIPAAPVSPGAVVYGPRTDRVA